jgi:hypothetical protein
MHGPRPSAIRDDPSWNALGWQGFATSESSIGKFVHCT